jgi:hypothetical protein
MNAPPDIHAALAAVIETPTVGFLWGQRCEFTPAVCSRVFGDGRALLALAPLNTRPRYYVVRIDSSWKNDGEDAPENADHLREHLDDIYDALSEDFGDAEDEDAEDDAERFRDWPALDLSVGTQWSRMSWPALAGVDQEPHPYASPVTIIAFPKEGR